MKISATGIAKAAYEAGFRNNALITAVAIALAESGGDTSASGYNKPTDGCPHGSVDRGIWQINDCYHNEVSAACTGNVDCAASAAYRISNSATNFTPWSTYNNGAYKRFLPDAIKAAGAIHGSHKSNNGNKSMFYKELGHWHYQAQMTMPRAAGYPPINRENDCGPACISMLIQHIFDIYISEDMINIVEGGPGHTGFTTNDEMIAYLLHTWGISTEVRIPSNASDAYNFAKAGIKHSFAVINLGNFYTNGGVINHYTVTTGIVSGNVIIADPGTGKREVVTKDDYFRRSYITQLCPLQARIMV